MKKAIISIIFVSTFYIASQEFDEEFLNSLPESVRADVISKGNVLDQIEEPIYRKASTMIDKESIEQENEDKKTEDNERRVFGYNFFDMIQTSFMPINEPNLSENYILDFGDIIEIQIIGQENSIESYELRRDGSVNVPNIGKIFLSGLSLKNADELIKERVKNTFIGTQSFTTLTNIRDVSILISGNAYNPGVYTLNGNSNILHALTMAGGINDIGSYRNIDLIRENKIIESLDMYELLVKGKSNFSKKLKTGDTIFVRTFEKLVTIESGVKRPGIYELKNDENIDDLIFLANGMLYNADKENIILKRVNANESNIINIDINNINATDLKDGDSLFIKEHKFNSIKISGAVNYPGTYLLPSGTKLSQLISGAGGYEEFAYTFGGFLNNLNSLEINEASKEKLYNKFLDNLIMNSSSSVSLSGQNSMGLILDQLKKAPVTGRIIAEFDLDVIAANPEVDTLLEDGDEIIIPSITQQVYVQGDVSNPGATRYIPGKDIDFYVKNSGGALDSADLNTLFIVHPNGETKNLNNNSRLSFINDQDVQLIYPGSIIYVPKDSNLASNIEVASIWAPIISSLALSITSLSVLNNAD